LLPLAILQLCDSQYSANGTPRASVSEQPAAIGIMFDIEDVPELGPSLVVKQVRPLLNFFNHVVIFHDVSRSWSKVAVLKCTV
jgi:hypothetical protein